MKNEVVYNNILESLRNGLNKKDSAIMAGIDESTFYRWMQSDASFASQVETNILIYKKSLIQDLNIQAKKNGALALRILEKRWPKEWGSSTYYYEDQNNGVDSIKLLVDKVDEILALPDDEDDVQSKYLS